MEQIYRRRSERADGARGRRERVCTERGYRQTLLQQTVICVLLFTGALFVKMSPREDTAFAAQSISYILTQQTDFGQLAEKSKAFLEEKVLKKTQQDGDLDSLANLTAPLDTEMISEFGMRVDPVSGEEKFHYGIDFSGEGGEKIKCVSDGTAEEIGSNEEYGNYILIRHGEKYASFYAHCEKILPVKGDAVKAGQVIATVGNSGNVTAPCLHFEIREGDTSLDPSVFLNQTKKS